MPESKRFATVTVTVEGGLRIDAIREIAAQFDEAVTEYGGPGRETSAALTELEKAVYFAVRAVALNHQVAE